MSAVQVQSNAYYSSDYEAGTGISKTTDNNPDYEPTYTYSTLSNQAGDKNPQTDQDNDYDYLGI